jgi:hypothetical protein
MNIFDSQRGGRVVRGMGICTTSSLVVDNQILMHDPCHAFIAWWVREVGGGSGGCR